jgi:hypothetical protein
MQSSNHQRNDKHACRVATGGIEGRHVVEAWHLHAEGRPIPPFWAYQLAPQRPSRTFFSSTLFLSLAYLGTFEVPVWAARWHLPTVVRANTISCLFHPRGLHISERKARKYATIASCVNCVPAILPSHRGRRSFRGVHAHGRHDSHQLHRCSISCDARPLQPEASYLQSHNHRFRVNVASAHLRRSFRPPQILGWSFGESSGTRTLLSALRHVVTASATGHLAL